MLFKSHREPSVNLWCRMTDTDDSIILSETKPDGKDWRPVVNWKRATRNKLQPYKRGSKAWKRAANDLLRSIHKSRQR